MIDLVRHDHTSQDVAKVIEALEAQCADYRTMYQVGVEQRQCILQDDLDGLNMAANRMRLLMDSIRARSAHMPAQLGRHAGDHPEIAERAQALKALISSIQEVRRTSETAIRDLQNQTRAELRRFDQGRRAWRGYGKASTGRGEEARFFDDKR
ncbi:MAG: flagellar export chaperone FlgN [Candidatus Latescibacterota bacterium]|nr:flagellar export chaperone FlgN [Candidatus Latescibacterota bacterium]